MTQEDKELLLKDLCARLPYGVIVETPKGKGHVCDINLTIFGTEVGVNINPTIRDTFDVEDVKPYLLPLSSMTEEQKSYINGRWGVNKHFEFEIDPLWGEYFVDLCDAVGFINWCYENHFDINGLIPRGLAIDATGKNIY
jgi:hypothetical protein